MDNLALEEIWSKIRLLMKSHPWHGVPIGKDYPETVTTYIEIVPTDTVKYEIEKHSIVFHYRNNFIIRFIIVDQS